MQTFDRKRGQLTKKHEPQSIDSLASEWRNENEIKMTTAKRGQQLDGKNTARGPKRPREGQQQKSRQQRSGYKRARRQEQTQAGE